ncbi:papain-like cysteine protease family protein [Parashewanella tropica]|uniref:papain-like cysteine protease family protein n=1 Tax=Parashewanella tropica TaxID=2547970 RepID=UPI001059A9FA|nr:papain-like cysteine protease family protein [Parashewanella tropica]
MKVPLLFSRLVNKRKKASTANYKAKNPGASGPHDVDYNLPYFHQHLVNECSEMSFTMLIGYYYPDKVVPNDAKRRGSFEGVDPHDLYISLVGNYPNLRSDFFRKITLEYVSKILKDNGPFVCSGDFARLLAFTKIRAGHTIVVKGIYGDKVIINDPWHGKDRYKSIDWFSALVDRNGGYFYIDEPSLRH